MHSRLRELLSAYPLPSGAGEPEVFTEAVTLGGLQSIELVGMVADIDGQAVSGSAGGFGEPPWDRAYFELLERLSITRAMARGRPLALRDANGASLGDAPATDVFPESPQPEEWMFARSNGVAIAPTWAEACERALAEAVERDAVQRSWYGELMLAPLPQAEVALWQPLSQFFELELRCVDWYGFVVTVAVGFPREASTPTCLGFGSRRDATASNVAAHAEFLQRFGFLWGEDIPSAEPPAEPNANYHQEYYLWPASARHLRRWLASGGARSDAPPQKSRANPDVGTRRGFAELTPADLVGKAAVARVLDPGLWPLRFGRGYPAPSRRAPVHAVHPIA